MAALRFTFLIVSHKAADCGAATLVGGRRLGGLVTGNGVYCVVGKSRLGGQLVVSFSFSFSCLKDEGRALYVPSE